MPISVNAAAAVGVTVGPALEVSPLDLRSYRAITLSNQLQVLLVSDELSDKAAAAIDVAVGHFSDPSELPGLAHFLEHMLFLGTEKYPEEGSYNKFLAENGGHSNAYTSAENTNFHFEMVANDKEAENGAEENGEEAPLPRFREALDRFAQFFTSPLFTESATERELNAVHSEHQKNLQNDGRRMYQLKKTVCNPKHPYCKFGTGSKETLWDTPKESGIDTRAQLLEFHKKFYSANLMTLCIIGPLALDQLQEWVAELFSGIPNHSAPNPCEEYKEIEPLLAEHRGLLFNMETIKEIRHLEIVWPTPSYNEYYRSKPSRYVGDLLGDEGDGSILSVLKAKGWADGLSAGAFDHMTFGVIQLTTTLTKEGVDHIDDIIGIIYDYLRIVREGGIQEWLFKEEATLAETAFRFRERGSAMGLVTDMASYMHNLPPAEYLSGQYLYKEFNARKIAEVLDCLTPENGNITVAGKFVSDKVTKKERWYETPYNVEQVEETRRRRWANANSNRELRIPEPNPFIPTEFDLLAEPLPDGDEDNEGPTEILQNEYMEIHHKLDRTFRRPKASVFISMKTPYAYLTPWHSVMSNLFTYILEDALSEYTYAAEKAGFMYSLSQGTSGIRLLVQGYSHRIDVLLAAVVKKMTTFEADATRFEMIRDNVERDYINFSKNQPYSLAMYNVNYLMEEPRWHVSDYLRVLADGSVTLKSLTQFSKDVQSRMFIKALVSGNICKESAIEVVKSVQTVIGYKPVPDIEQIHRRIVQAPIGRDVYTRNAHPNKDDNNSAIDVFFPIGPRGDFVTDVTLEVLADILNKPTFHELRTVQQLGYIVFEGVTSLDHVRGIYVIVQSTVAGPDDLLARIDKFLVEARKDVLETMTEEKFQDYVRSQITTKAEPDKKLSARSWRFWKELMEGYRQYDRAQKEIEALRSISKADVVECFDSHIAPGGKARRRVISQIFGNQHPLAEKTPVPEGALEVGNPLAFRRCCSLYPVGGVHDPLTNVRK